MERRDLFLRASRTYLLPQFKTNLPSTLSYLRLFKKVSDARRAMIEERKRTLQYVEASRASATKQVSLFQQPATS
jgi:hypothetical protein